MKHHEFEIFFNQVDIKENKNVNYCIVLNIRDTPIFSLTTIWKNMNALNIRHSFLDIKFRQTK